MAETRSAKRIVLITAAIAATSAAALLWSFDPATARIYPPCLFHWLTGLSCPGCGSVRALHALLHGRIADAIHYNPLLFVTPPAIALVLLHDRHCPPHSRMGNRPALAYVALLILIAFAVLRNIPGHPFSLLLLD